MITTMTLNFATSGVAAGNIALDDVLFSEILNTFFPSANPEEQITTAYKGLPGKSVKVSMTLDTTGLIPVLESELELDYDEAIERANRILSKARLDVSNYNNPDSKIRTIINNGRSLTFEIPLVEFKAFSLGSATPLVFFDGLVEADVDGEPTYVSVFSDEAAELMDVITANVSVIATFQMGTDFGFSTQENRTFHAQSSKNLHPIEFTRNKTMGEQQYYHVKNKPYTVLEGVVDTRTIRSKKNYQEVL